MNGWILITSGHSYFLTFIQRDMHFNRWIQNHQHLLEKLNIPASSSPILTLWNETCLIHLLICTLLYCSISHHSKCSQVDKQGLMSTYESQPLCECVKSTHWLKLMSAVIRWHCSFAEILATKITVMDYSSQFEPNCNKDWTFVPINSSVFLLLEINVLNHECCLLRARLKSKVHLWLSPLLQVHTHTRCCALFSYLFLWTNLVFSFLPDEETPSRSSCLLLIPFLLSLAALPSSCHKHPDVLIFKHTVKGPVAIHITWVLHLRRPRRLFFISQLWSGDDEVKARSCT